MLKVILAAVGVVVPPPVDPELVESPGPPHAARRMVSITVIQAVNLRVVAESIPIRITVNSFS
jgi:hypothetical protein